MNRLRQLRVDGGLLLQDVATQAGVSRKTLARLEQNEIHPQGSVHAPTLAKLGRFYGVQPSALLGPAVYEEEAA